MENSTDIQLTPGFYSYVLGEEPDVHIAESNLDLQHSYLRNLCTHIMYNPQNNPAQYYHLGSNRFIYECTHEFNDDIHHPIGIINLTGTILYYYNRQLIIQMTFSPKPFPFQKIHIPINRESNNEIQVDILALAPNQQIANFNLPYLVVIEEPFTRFIWCFPTAKLLSSYVRKAFLLALSRPGIGHDFYIHIRDRIQRLVVDGGSEFKDVFQGNYRQAFPNATLIRSFAKSKTRGRPTNSGAVEAGIATLRRVLRDYEFRIHPQFLLNRQNGLNEILDSYNNMPQIQTLLYHSPQQLVDSYLSKGDPKLISLLSKHMINYQQQQIIKKVKIYKKYEIDNQNLLITDHNAYRIYLPPNPFSKQVELRVSLKAYIIEHIHGGRNNPYVDLIEYGNQGNERLTNIHLKQLVSVKSPIHDGPEIIKRNLTANIELLRVRHTPKEISIPFDLSPKIRQALGNDAPVLEAQLNDNNPLVRAQRNHQMLH